MMVRVISFELVLMMAVSAPVLLAQSLNSVPTQNPSTKEQTQGASDLPTYELQFSKIVPVAGVQSSPLIVQTPQCSSSGVVFLQMLQPPSYRDIRVVSLKEGGGNTYTLAQVPGLYDITLLSFFPSSKEIAFLVLATKNNQDSQTSMMSPAGPVTVTGKAGPYRNYIVLLSQDGTYKSTIDLPADLEFQRMAMLDSGEFALLAYSPTNRTAALEILSSSGQFERSVALTEEMSSDPELAAGQTGDVIEPLLAASALTRWQFVGARNRVLLYRPHARGDVIELGSGGATRYVPLESPDGFTLDGIIPSDDQWIVRYRRKSLSDESEINGSPASGNYLVYSVNPMDGSLSSRLTSRSSAITLLCEANSAITSFSVDKDSHFLLKTAQLPK
jgi:hypothetical protein